MTTFMDYWFKQGKEMEAMKCYERCVVPNKLPVCSDTGSALLKILLKYGKKTHAWALYHDMFDQSQKWDKLPTLRLWHGWENGGRVF